MSTSLRRKVIAAIFVPFPVMLLVCLFFLWQVSDVNSRAKWVSHTDEVLAKTQLCQKLLLDQETGLRGYLLSGRPAFLDPYRHGTAEFPKCMSDLEALTADNQIQQERLAALNAQYRGWKSMADPAAQSSGAVIRTTELVEAVAQRKAEMDRMRASFDAIAHTETELLQERKVRAADAARTMMIGFSAALVALGILLVLYLHKLTSTIDQTYSAALDAQQRSEQQERKARLAAEELASEIAARSKEMEQSFVTVRRERDEAFLRLRELESRG